MSFIPSTSIQLKNELLLNELRYCVTSDHCGTKSHP